MRRLFYCNLLTLILTLGLVHTSQGTPKREREDQTPDLTLAVLSKEARAELLALYPRGKRLRSRKTYGQRGSLSVAEVENLLRRELRVKNEAISANEDLELVERAFQLIPRKFIRERNRALSSISRVPDDPLKLIFSFLDTQDLLRAAQVSKRFRALAYSPEVWLRRNGA